MKRIALFILGLCCFLGMDAKQFDLPLFPRTFGYYTQGNVETKTIIWNKGYGRYGWQNKQKADLSIYKTLVLKIEPTDSRIEVHVVYEDKEDVKVGQLNMGKGSIELPFDGNRAVKAIYMAKSKPGQAKVLDFYLTDSKL